MAAGQGKGKEDFYARLGLKKECSAIELRQAYKKLALRWHPDRCPASEKSKFVDEAKEKFQSIQEAYTVLSDTNKRFLYDVGIYESDEEDDNGMTNFMGEMATMMSQEKGGESFEELQVMFEDMCHKDHNPQPDTSSSSSAFVSVNKRPLRTQSCKDWSTWNEPTTSNLNKRNSQDMSSSNAYECNASHNQSAFNPIHRTFSLGAEGGDNNSRKNWRRKGGRKEANCLFSVSKGNNS